MAHDDVQPFSLVLASLAALLHKVRLLHASSIVTITPTTNITYHRLQFLPRSSNGRSCRSTGQLLCCSRHLACPSFAGRITSAAVCCRLHSTRSVVLLLLF
jgi:hypothetical protein